MREGGEYWSEKLGGGGKYLGIRKRKMREARSARFLRRERGGEKMLERSFGSEGKNENSKPASTNLR